MTKHNPSDPGHRVPELRRWCDLSLKIPEFDKTLKTTEDCQILTTVACWRCLTGSVRSGGIHPEIKVKTLFFCSSVRLWVWSCSLVEITFNWPISVDLICSVQWILIRISYHHCVACCLHNEKNLQATASFIDHYFQCVTWRWFVQGQIFSSRIQNSSSRFKSRSV